MLEQILLLQQLLPLTRQGLLQLLAQAVPPLLELPGLKGPLEIARQAGVDRQSLLR